LKLDTNSRDILKFRPNINFVEPDQEEGEIKAQPDPIPFEDIIDERKKIKAYADALKLLAELTQSLIDNEAEGQIIELDSGVDALTIQAMRRSYPDADPNRIIYGQYKLCEDSIRDHGYKIGQNATITPEDVAKAREALLKNKDVPIGGLGTEASKNGGLRPELDKKNQIVKPIDLDKFKDELIKVLVNMLWKSFIKPILPLPFLPDELVKVSKSTKSMLSDIEQKVTT